MRDFTSYIFVITIIVATILGAILIYYIEKKYKIVCSLDDKSEQYSQDIKRLDLIKLKIEYLLKILYIAQAIFIFTIIDSNWIYEYQLKNYFNSGEVLLCKQKSEGIDLFAVSNSEYVLKDEKWFIIPTRKLYKKSDLTNHLIDINFCKPKDKKWYQ